MEILTNSLRRTLLQSKWWLEKQLAHMDAEAAEEFIADEFGVAGDADCRRGAALDKTMRELMRRYPGRPLIAYGSSISGGNDNHSDLDLLVLEYDANGRPRQETFELNGLKIDVTRVGSKVLLKTMEAEAKLNNNWFLNALRHCAIYGDRDGEAQRLLTLAQQAWGQGPRGPSREQVQEARAALLRLQDSASKLCARAAASREATRIARMRCDQLASQAIYLFYWARREWTTSLHRLVGRCRTEHPEFYELWLQYVRAEQSDELLSAAKSLADAVHRDLLLRGARRTGINAQAPLPQQLPDLTAP